MRIVIALLLGLVAVIAGCQPGNDGSAAPPAASPSASTVDPPTVSMSPSASP